MPAPPRRMLQLMASLKACSDLLVHADENVCSKACRGQVRPAGESAGMQVCDCVRGAVMTTYIESREMSRLAPDEALSELDEMSCTLAGRKPLTLLHRFFPEAQSLAQLCRAGMQAHAGSPFFFR